MNFIEKIQTIRRVDRLISMKATGTPQKLAEKLNVSRSTIYEIIDCMEELGASISYCRIKKTFYYEYDVELSLSFITKRKELNQFKGGFDFFYSVRLFTTN